MALIVVFTMILLPYIYYSIKVYRYIHSDDRLNIPDGQIAPNDPRCIHYTDIWISFVSAFVIHVTRWVILNYGKPLVRAIRIRKPNESDKMQEIQI